MELYNQEQKSATVRSGTITTFFKRASAFSLRVREINETHTTPGDISENWHDFGLKFVVVGESSQDSYQYLRIRHPSSGVATKSYEFQIFPINGAAIASMPRDEDFIQLISGKSTDHRKYDSTNSTLSGFSLETHSVDVKKSDITETLELMSKGEESPPVVTTTNKPKTVTRLSLLPDPGEDRDIKVATEFEWRRNELTRTDGSLHSPGGYGAWQYEVLGNSDDDSTPIGKYKTFKNIESQKKR